MQYFAQDGLRLAYEVYWEGGDEPLVLLHGLGADHAMWAPQVDRYSDAGYTLLVPDVRGHGESDGPATFSIDDCASDLAALLSERGLSSVSVCGVSMGGLIAQRFAIDHPEMVRALVLADTFSGIHGPIAQLNARAGEIGLSLLPGVLQWKIVESHFDAPDQAELREYFRTMLFQTDPDLLKQARRAVNRFDCRGDLDRIDAPTLVLVGENNGSWFLALTRETAEGIEGASLEVLADGSDPSNLTVPTAFDDAVLSFLEPAT